MSSTFKVSTSTMEQATPNVKYPNGLLPIPFPSLVNLVIFLDPNIVSIDFPISIVDTPRSDDFF